MSQVPRIVTPQPELPQEAKPDSNQPSLVRKLYSRLPGRTRSRIRTFLALPAATERRWYLRLLFRHSVLRQAWRYRRPEFPVRSVLFVCYGNIMRSAFAEAAMRREAEQRGWAINIASAGTNARPGKAADSRAAESALKHGLSLEKHRARLLDRKLVEEADVIVPMDYMNAARILARFPDAAERVVLLGGLVGARGDSLEFVDPYDQSSDEAGACFDRIAGSVTDVARALGNETGP